MDKGKITAFFIIGSAALAVGYIFPFLCKLIPIFWNFIMKYQGFFISLWGILGMSVSLGMVFISLPLPKDCTKEELEGALLMPAGHLIINSLLIVLLFNNIIQDATILLFLVIEFNTLSLTILITREYLKKLKSEG